VQKFWKSVKIWQSYREFKGGPFFWDTVYYRGYYRILLHVWEINLNAMHIINLDRTVRQAQELNPCHASNLLKSTMLSHQEQPAITFPFFTKRCTACKHAVYYSHSVCDIEDNVKIDEYIKSWDSYHAVTEMYHLVTIKSWDSYHAVTEMYHLVTETHGCEQLAHCYTASNIRTWTHDFWIASSIDVSSQNCHWSDNIFNSRQ